MTVYPAQINMEALVTCFFYIYSTLNVFLAVAAIVIFDAGLVKQKNMIDTIMQKVVAIFISGMSFMVIGYAIWNLEIYQTLPIDNPFTAVLSDWSFFGKNMNQYARFLDPKTAPEAELFQIFSIFFFMFAGLTAAFIHSAGLERIKPSALYIMSAIVGGLVAPFLYYLTFSSTSFLTNNGMHDYVGIYSVYLFCGVWSVVMSWKLGPRAEINHDYNYTLITIGGLLLMVAVPALVIGNGFAIPEKGYFGITMNDSGLGMVLINVFMALGSGAISGAIIAYRKSNPSFVFMGALAGYISGTALFDICLPWQMVVVAFFAPHIVYQSIRLLERFGIDDPKVGPLALGPAIYGALVAGVIGNGIPTGGFFGITSGQYAYQHAHISLAMQAVGVVTIVIGTVAFELVLLAIIDKLVGLRVTPAQELQGLDRTYWSNALDHHEGAHFSLSSVQSSEPQHGVQPAEA